MIDTNFTKHFHKKTDKNKPYLSKRRPNIKPLKLILLLLIGVLLAGVIVIIGAGILAQFCYTNKTEPADYPNIILLIYGLAVLLSSYGMAALIRARFVMPVVYFAIIIILLSCIFGGLPIIWLDTLKKVGITFAACALGWILAYLSNLSYHKTRKSISNNRTLHN